MGFRLASMVCVLLALLVGPRPAQAQDESGPGADNASVKMSDIWVLNFKYKKVGMIQPTRGIHRGEVYWYMIYQIENKTGKDREAYISITAGSNKNKTYANISLPDLESILEKKEGKPLWGKADEAKILKKRAEQDEITEKKGMFNYFPFKAGKTVDCVAIFNRLDPVATDITIHVDGLSNDYHLIKNEDGSQQIQSRSYILKLKRPGDEYGMNLDRFHLVQTGWTKKITNLAVPKEN